MNYQTPFPRTTSNKVKEQELPYEEAGEQAKKGGREPNHQMDYCDNIRLSTVILNFQLLIFQSGNVKSGFGHKLILQAIKKLHILKFKTNYQGNIKTVPELWTRGRDPGRGQGRILQDQLQIPAVKHWILVLKSEVCTRNVQHSITRSVIVILYYYC